MGRISDFGQRQRDWLRLCDTGEAAAMLGVDRQQARRLIRRHRLASWKDDGRIVCWWLDVRGLADLLIREQRAARL